MGTTSIESGASFQEWMTEGQVFCRGIMALCPEGAEKDLQVRAFSAALEEADPAAAWFCLVDGGQKGYICRRDDHTGAWMNSEEALRKAGVDPVGLPVLEIDWTRHTVSAAMTDFRDRLQAALGATPGFTQDERQGLMVLHECLGMVLGACQDGYTDKMTADGLKTLLPAFLSPTDPPVTLAEKLDALEQMSRSVLRMREFLTADVFLTARLMLFPALLAALAERMKAGGAEEWQSVAQLTRFFLTPYSEGISDPPKLLPALVEKMAREGYGGLVESEAKSRLSAGMAAIEDALNADGLDDYGARLYAATHECFSASHLYEILDHDAKSHPNPPVGKWWAQSSKVAEEKLVRCANALFRLSHDPFLGALNRHRRRVAEAYRSGGDEARDAAISDLIENNYFYPRCFKSRLAETPSDEDPEP